MGNSSVRPLGDVGVIKQRFMYKYIGSTPVRELTVVVVCVCVCVFCFVVIHDPPLLYMKYMVRQSWVDTLTHGVGGSVGCVMVSLPVLSGLFTNASLGCISPASLSVTPCSGWLVLSWFVFDVDRERTRHCGHDHATRRRTRRSHLRASVCLLRAMRMLLCWRCHVDRMVVCWG